MRSRLLIGAVAIASVYLFGAYSVRHQLFPIAQLVALREQARPAALQHPESRYLFDAQDRLVADESKVGAPCPQRSSRTAVLLVMGQSNAANYAGQRFSSGYGAQVVNFYDGACFVAASPLLGSGGSKGEYWTELGNKLIGSGGFDHVVIAPVAFSGSAVARWAHGGDLNGVMRATVSKLLASGLNPTEVLWDQGEYDYVVGTSEADYGAHLLSMIDTLRAAGVSAPVYLSIASKCLEPSNNGTKTHAPDNPVVRAQLALSNGAAGIWRGVNTDALLTGVDRYDDCHIGGSGAEKVAQAWADILLARIQRGSNADDGSLALR